MQNSKTVTITISTPDNRVINVNASELTEIVRLEGLEKIEVSDKFGWDYLENKMLDAGFKWNYDETTAENINRFLPLYEAYLQKETREEEFGRIVNEKTPN